MGAKILRGVGIPYSMYIKILRGGERGYDSRKLTAYTLRESASAHHISNNLFIADPNDTEEASRAFDRHHNLHTLLKGGAGKRIKRPLIHIIARAAPEDGELSSETFSRMTTSLLKQLGLSPQDYPYHAQSHTDEAGTRNHIHIIASRISNKEGKVWYGRREGELCWKVKTSIEKEFNLHRTKTMAEFKDRGTKTLRRSEVEQQMKKRGIVSNKEAIAAAIIASLEDSSGSWEHFELELRKYQIEVEVIERPSGRHGVAFALNGCRIPGSKLGRGFSYAQLKKSLKELKEGRVQDVGKIGLKIDPERLATQAPPDTQGSPKKDLEFDQSQLEDLRKVEQGKYPDLSAQAASIFSCYSLQRRNVIVFIICLLATRSMVKEFKSREIKDLHRKRRTIDR